MSHQVVQMGDEGLSDQAFLPSEMLGDNSGNKDVDQGTPSRVTH